MSDIVKQTAGNMALSGMHRILVVPPATFDDVEELSMKWEENDV